MLCKLHFAQTGGSSISRELLQACLFVREGSFASWPWGLVVVWASFMESVGSILTTSCSDFRLAVTPVWWWQLAIKPHVRNRV
jgi:hypothetical protein